MSVDEPLRWGPPPKRDGLGKARSSQTGLYAVRPKAAAAAQEEDEHHGERRGLRPRQLTH